MVELCDDPLTNLCCGAGGGAWAMPHVEERLAFGRTKADQIKRSGAELVISPCHNCRDQIMKALPKKFNIGNHKQTMYIWELVAKSLIIEPWSDEEIRQAHEERNAQFKRDNVETKSP
jgi:Fe-S oxidoreductase